MVARALVLALLAGLPGSVAAQGHTDVLPPGAGPDRVAFVDVAVVRTVGKHPGVTYGQTVVVENGRIAEIGANEWVPVLPGVRRIDASGLYLMAGLIDMHAHLAVPPGPDEGPAVFAESDQAMLAQYLAAGVTTVRNLWGSRSALRARRRVASGVWSGPRVVTAGPLVDARSASQRGVPFDVRELARRPSVLRIETPADAREAVLYHRALGYDLVKVYDGVPARAFAALAETAAAFGLPVVGHVPDAVGLAGVRARPGPSLHSVEHTLPFAKAAVPAGAPVSDDFLAAELARYALADTVRLAVWAEAAAARGTAVVPTLGLLARTYGARGGHDDLLASIDAAPVSALQRQRWRAVAERHAARLARFDSLGYDGAALGRAPLDAGLALVRALDAAGAPILLGTDAPASLAPPAEAVLGELQLLVRAGLSPLRALRAATSAPGGWLARHRLAPPFSGRMVEGAPSDLVLLRANPAVDVAAVREVEAVVAWGRLWERSELGTLARGREGARSAR